MLVTLRYPLLRSSSPWYKPLRHPTNSVFRTTTRTFLRPSRCLREEVTAQNPASAEPLNQLKLLSFYEKVGKPGIRKQIIFVALTSFVGFSIAAAQTSVDTDDWKEKVVASSPVMAFKTVTNMDIKRAQAQELVQRLRATLANMQSNLSYLPMLLRPWINIAYVAIMQPYADASEGKRLCWKICLINAAVYAAWKVRQWRGFMDVRFMHHPLSGLAYTLVTSMFSHRTFFHLLVNCMALEGFGSAAYFYLFKEQSRYEPEILESTTSYHFLAFFLSAGMFSGLVSHIVNAKYRYPRLVAQLASSTHRRQKTETWASAVAASTSAAPAPVKGKILDILPSLGASGAIYAAVTMTALAFPDSQVALFIPPSYPINIQIGVGGLMLMDTIGILRGWRYFDHWAHLGGAAFGIFYYNYGPSYWRHLRSASVQQKKASE